MKNMKKILLSLMVTFTMMLSLGTTNVFAADSFECILTPTDLSKGLEVGKEYDHSLPYVIGRITVNGAAPAPDTKTRAKLASGALPTGMELITNNGGIVYINGTPTTKQSFTFSLVMTIDDVDMGLKPIEMTVTVAEAVDTNVYTIKEKELVRTVGSKGGRYISIASSGKMDTEKFTGVKMDGVLVEDSNYMDKGLGSDGKYHVIEFYEAFLNSLSVGTHEISFMYGQKEAKGPFTILKAEAPKPKPAKKTPPKTGDESIVAIYSTGLLLAGYLAITTYRKKENC